MSLQIFQKILPEAFAKNNKDSDFYFMCQIASLIRENSNFSTWWCESTTPHHTTPHHTTLGIMIYKLLYIK
jgi:hypothetical protein